MQLHRPFLVKFWLPVLIAHLASPQLVVARNCLGILCAFAWINTLHAVPAYLREDFEQSMVAFERNVDSWEASGELEGARADGLRFLVASKFWHLPSASTVAEFPGMPEMRDVRVPPPPPEVGRLHNLAINEVRHMYARWLTWTCAEAVCPATGTLEPECHATGPQQTCTCAFCTVKVHKNEQPERYHALTSSSLYVRQCRCSGACSGNCEESSSFRRWS